MENLKIKYDELMKIHQMFMAGVKRYQDALADKSIDIDTRDSIRDSLIKRFELMYDFLVKYLRRGIFVVQRININSPRKMFQQCLSLGVVNKEEAKELVDLIKYRSLTKHAYDNDVANTVANDIQKHHDVISTVIEKVSLEAIKK